MFCTFTDDYLFAFIGKLILSYVNPAVLRNVT